MSKEKKPKKTGFAKASPNGSGTGSKQEEYLAGWKRALADYENLKKSIGIEKDQERQRVRESIAHDLLPVVDNFEQAIHHLPDLSEDEKSKLNNWLTGVEYIKKQFEEVMNTLGIQPITETEMFDPNLHEASGEEKDEKKEEGAIIKIIQTGWKMQDRVIRPAKVIINKK